MGKLELVIGCMFSGKTTKLFELSKKHIGKKILGINYKHNFRYDTNQLITHDKKKFNFTNEVQLDKLNDLIISEYYSYYDTSDIIIIDEIQFFKDAYTFIFNAINIDKKHIICAGLNSDFNKKNFDVINLLIPEADEIYFLKANCSCGKQAIFSKRIIKDNTKILIGSSEKYKPVCRLCYNQT